MSTYNTWCLFMGGLQCRVFADKLLGLKFGVRLWEVSAYVYQQNNPDLYYFNLMTLSKVTAFYKTWHPPELTLFEGVHGKKPKVMSD